MHKKRLYLVQACDKPDGFTTLPYSIGVLAAFAFQNETVRSGYELCGLIVDKVEKRLLHEQLREPDVVAFSCYIWNLEYNKQAARRLKELYPGCVIIFGGHSIPIHPSGFLRDFPFVDYLIHGEGEIPFTALLAALHEGGEPGTVPNISYVRGSEVIYRYDPSVVAEDYPSPYLLGLFDDYVLDTDRKCTATLETNRGCPFHCAYCDWGLNRARLRMMDLDKLSREIEWMGKNRIFSCNGADSNFGLFARDDTIAELLAETRRRYGYPKKFSVSFSKQSDERVLRIGRTLHAAGLLAGVTLSFQSLNPATLKAIGRENLSLDYFRAQMERYNAEGIPTYSEIILGLPEETYDSFAAGISRLVECGQYRNINIYFLTLLPNSELGGERAIEKYGLETLNIPSRLLYCKADASFGEVREYSDIVVRTNTLSRDDWARCKCFASILKGFHSYGVTLYISTFLAAIADISVREIYEALMSWIFETGAFGIYIRQHEWWTTALRSREPLSELPDVYRGYRVPEEEKAFLQITEDVPGLYERLEAFFNRYAGAPCWSDLVRFQKAAFRYVYTGEATGEKLNYDFVAFFNDVLRGARSEPQKTGVRLDADYLSGLRLLPKRISVSF